MKYPIIELRQNKLFVVDEFFGKINGKWAIMPFNKYRNLTEFVIDSSGTCWTFNYQKNDSYGVKKFISYFWNISSDFYLLDVTSSITVGQFSSLLSKYSENENPDDVDLAESMLKPLKGIDESAELSSVISKLNL